MKIRMLACGFVLGLGAAIVMNSAFSQDRGGGSPGAGASAGKPSPEEMKGMMDAMEKAMKPGEHHKKLDVLLGQWDTATRIFMEGPNSPATEMHGSAECKWVLDGRFMKEEFKGELKLPDPATGELKPMPWNGLGLFGYDNFRNVYVGCWMDTAGTQMLTMKGSASPDGKMFTYYGEMDEPMLSLVGRTVKYQTKIVDADTHIFTIYDLHAGDDYKVVEVTYKRKK